MPARVCWCEIGVFAVHSMGSPPSSCNIERNDSEKRLVFAPRIFKSNIYAKCIIKVNNLSPLITHYSHSHRTTTKWVCVRRVRVHMVCGPLPRQREESSIENREKYDSCGAGHSGKLTTRAGGCGTSHLMYGVCTFYGLHRTRSLLRTYYVLLAFNEP